MCNNKIEPVSVEASKIDCEIETDNKITKLRYSIGCSSGNYDIRINLFLTIKEALDSLSANSIIENFASTNSWQIIKRYSTINRIFNFYYSAIEKSFNK